MKPVVRFFAASLIQRVGRPSVTYLRAKQGKLEVAEKVTSVSFCDIQPGGNITRFETDEAIFVQVK